MVEKDNKKLMGLKQVNCKKKKEREMQSLSGVIDKG